MGLILPLGDVDDLLYNIVQWVLFDMNRVLGVVYAQSAQIRGQNYT